MNTDPVESGDDAMFDLGPAASELSRLVSAVTDDQLGASTPCRDWTVSDLLAHLHQFASVFTSNARKAPVRPPNGLVDDWRTALPAQLADLAAAWRDESAWTGRLSAGGIEMAASDNAVVAIEELTVHAWDLARATGRDLHTDDSTLDAVEPFFALFGARIASGDGPFRPAVDVPAGSSRLDRTVARTGRDPSWRAG